MSNFILDRVVPIVIGFGIALGFCVFAGFLTVSATDEMGPTALLEWGLLITVIMVPIATYMGYVTINDAMQFNRPKLALCIIAIVMAVSTFALPFNTLMHGHEDAVYHRQMAQKVEDFALQHFDELDTLHGGIISDGDITQALHALRYRNEERTLLAYMQAELSEVGHVTYSYTTTMTIYQKFGDVTIPQTEKVTHYTYGISKDDLKQYPRRVREKYKQW